MENHQYTAEGTIEQLSSLAAGLARRRYGRVAAWIVVVLAVVVPGVVAAAVLAMSLV